MRLSYLLLFACVLSLSASAADAQNPRRGDAAMSLGEVKPTPEMWLYSQEVRRSEDPKTILRLRAQRQTEERRARIATRKSLGISASRPTWSHTPWWGSRMHTLNAWYYPPAVLESQTQRADSPYRR